VVFLPEYVRESDGMLNALLPFLAFESKERFDIPLGNRGQLEKIARNDQLESVCVESPPQIQERSSSHLYAAKRPFGLLP